MLSILLLKSDHLVHLSQVGMTKQVNPRYINYHISLHLDLFWVKEEEMTEGRKAGRQVKQNRAPILAQGLEAPLMQIGSMVHSSFLPL